MFKTAGGKDTDPISVDAIQRAQKIIFSQSQHPENITNENRMEEVDYELPNHSFGNGVESENERRMEEVDDELPNQLSIPNGITPENEISSIPQNEHGDSTLVDIPLKLQQPPESQVPDSQITEDYATRIFSEVELYNESEANAKKNSSTLKPIKPRKSETTVLRSRKKTLDPLLKNKRTSYTGRTSIAKDSVVIQLPQNNVDDVSSFSSFLKKFGKFHQHFATKRPITLFNEALNVFIMDDNVNEKRKLELSEWAQFFGSNFDSRWLEIQLKHVLWKRMAYHYHNPTKYPLPTISSIISEIHWRYNYEVYNGDDTSERSHICVVTNITKDNGGMNVLEVSDGWYVVKLKLDKELDNVVNQNKIIVGMKLRVYGDILNLQVNAWSVKRARNEEKLGLCKCVCFLVLLKSIHNNGLVSGVRICIERKFQPLYRIYDDGVVKNLNESELNEYYAKLKQKMSKQRKVGNFMVDQDQIDSLPKAKAYQTFQVIDANEKIKYLEGQHRMKLVVWLNPEDIDLKEKCFYDILHLKSKKLGDGVQLETTPDTVIKQIKGRYPLPSLFDERKIMDMQGIIKSKKLTEVDIVCVVLQNENECLYVTDSTMKISMIKKINEKCYSEWEVLLIKNIKVESFNENNIIFKQLDYTEFIQNPSDENEKKTIYALQSIVNQFNSQYEPIKNFIDNILFNSDNDMEIHPQSKLLLDKDYMIECQQKEINDLRKQLENINP
ncbi:BRCA2 OB1 domain-containing protein [Entamoeba marina]